jgi:hypothetical protein
VNNITLVFEFDNLADAAAFMARHVPTVPFIPEVATAPAPDGQKEEAPAKPRGRPRKVADTTEKVSTQSEPEPTVQVNPAFNPEVTPAVTPEVAPAAPAETPAEGLKWAATFDGSRDALREVFNLKGAAVATELLKQFNAARISDVKPMDYAKFVTAATKSLA